MILFCGTINDDNIYAVRKKYLAIWLEPTANLSLFEVNGLVNEIFESIYDDSEIVVWTNHPEILKYAARFSKVFVVDEGVIYDITEKVEKEEGNPNSIGVVELILRNWFIVD